MHLILHCGLNKAQATKELKRLSSDVKHRTLLLSNESMYHFIIHSKQRELLKEICKELGFIKVTLILVFRNIYTHAVSAYTHRVDIPGVPSFGEWILGQKEKNANFERGVDGYEFWDEAVLAPSLQKAKQLHRQKKAKHSAILEQYYDRRGRCNKKS